MDDTIKTYDEHEKEHEMGNAYEAELIGLAADRRHHGDCDGDGFGFGGGMGGFLLGALLGGGGFGNWGNRRGDDCAIPTLMNDNVNSKFQMLAGQTQNGFDALGTQIQTGNIVDAVRFVDKAVCDNALQAAIGFGNTNANIIESRYQTALGLATTNGKIEESKYQAALLAKEASAQLMECCCELKMEGRQNTQAILDKLCQLQNEAKDNEIEKLRFKQLRNDCKDDTRDITQIIGSSITTTLTSLLSGNSAG